MNIKCQPVVLNSGAIWPKKGSMSYKKKLYISILKPIEPGMNDDQFINCLQENMYNELEKFIETKISSISTSPERDDTILVEDPFNN